MDRAAAEAIFALIISEYTETDIVIVLAVYRSIEALSSLIIVTQLKIAPENTPGSIRRAVTLKKVLTGGHPRLIEASSTAGLI